MTRRVTAEQTLERIRSSALDAQRIAVWVSTTLFLLAGAWLFVPLSWFQSAEPKASSWMLMLVVAGGAAGAWLGTALARLPCFASYRLYYDHARSVLLDAALLEKVLNEDAYERLPSLGRQPERSTGLSGMWDYWTESLWRRPGPATDGFDRRIRDLLRSWPLLLHDLGWQSVQHERAPGWVLALMIGPLVVVVLFLAVLALAGTGPVQAALDSPLFRFLLANVGGSLGLAGLGVQLAGSGAEPAGIRFALLDTLSGMSVYDPDPVRAAAGLGLHGDLELHNATDGTAGQAKAQATETRTQDTLGWG